MQNLVLLFVIIFSFISFVSQKESKQPRVCWSGVTNRKGTPDSNIKKPPEREESGEYMSLSKTKAKQILRDIWKQYGDQAPPIKVKELERINIIALQEAAEMSQKAVAEALGYTV